MIPRVWCSPLALPWPSPAATGGSRGSTSGQSPWIGAQLRQRCSFFGDSKLNSIHKGSKNSTANFEGKGGVGLSTLTSVEDTYGPLGTLLSCMQGGRHYSILRLLLSLLQHQQVETVRTPFKRGKTNSAKAFRDDGDEIEMAKFQP